jgi:subtilase family serine protease
VSYPPYGQNPQNPQNPQQPRPPQNPYGQQPPPPNPYGQQPPPPPNPYGRPAQQPPQPPPPQNPYGGQPPYGGGPGGPGGPGGSGGPGIPGGQGGGGFGGGSNGGGSGRSKGPFIAIGVVLALLVTGGVVYAASGKHKSPVAGSSGGVDGTAQGGNAWVPPSWAVPANDVGEADAKTVITGTVYFAKSHPQDLATYAAEVGTPGDSKYHKFLSPDDFTSTFTNHADASQSVTQWVQSAGMTIVSQTPQSINVSTTIGKVEDTLKIKIHKFKHSGRVDISATSQPQFPANVGDYVASVTGLTASSPVDKPHLQPLRASGADCSSYYGQRMTTAPALPGGGAPAQLLCGYSASQVRSAYGVTNSGYTGKGVTIAVVDAFASPTIVDDVNRWSRENGLPAFTSGQFSQVVPDSYAEGSSADLASGWWGEETLDIEAVHAMAPDAKIVYYGTTEPDDAKFFTVFQQIVSHHTADIVTNSWGGTESTTDQADFPAGEQIFEQAAAEGITFNFSTGDDGDYTKARSNPTASPAASYPSGDPWVTAVGGTSLGVGSHGQYMWETGWGDMAYPAAGGSWDTSHGTFHEGGGGGNSMIFPQPGFQKGVVPDDLATAASGKSDREQPDVAMLADPLTGFVIGQTTGKVTAQSAADGGVTFTMTGGKFANETWGGTSLATPLFTGMEALAEQASGTGLGFADPVLYHLYNSPQFHDVVPNPVDGHEPGFLAGDGNGGDIVVALNQDSSLKTAKGYDDVTGLGSPTPAFISWFKDHPNGN